MKLILRIAAIAGFLVLIGLTIAYARGYRFNLHEKSLTATGIIAINSYPRAAKVYINGELKGVTALNLTLPPGQYQIEIKKDGYTSWSKSVNLKGELVYTIDALLFPLNPSLSPLTNLGVVKAVPVNDTGKVIIFSDNNNPEKDGIYLFEADKGLLSLLPPLKLLLLKSTLAIGPINFSKTEVYFSPDAKQAIFTFKTDNNTSSAYLISLEQENTTLFEVTSSQSTLLTAWEAEKEREVNKVLETFPEEIAKVATSSFNIVGFSPDKIKMLYQPKINLELPVVINPPLIATNQTPEERSLNTNKLYIYDKKEDKNYLLDLNQEIRNWKLKIENLVSWYPDSLRLVFYDNKKISVVDYDGSNRRTLYSGPIEDSFFAITSDGKIIIQANLNPENNLLPDLYLVGIR